MCFTPTPWNLFLCLTELNCGTDSSWMSTEITSHLQGAWGFVQPGCALVCVLSDTGPPSPSLCSPIKSRQHRVCVLHPLIGCHQNSYLFSSGFLKTQAYGFYCIHTCSQQKNHHFIWEQNCADVKVGICTSMGRKKITLMLSLLLYWSSLELYWVGIQHFPIAAFLLNENPIQVIWFVPHFN